MNTSKLKAYAPQARQEFIEAVKVRAAKFGITESDPVEMMVRDDVAMIYGEAYPKEVFQQRQGLLELVNARSYEPAMEAMAYTWFNRYMALVDSMGFGAETLAQNEAVRVDLSVNPANRYGKKLTEEEQWTHFRADTLGREGN